MSNDCQCIIAWHSCLTSSIEWKIKLESLSFGCFWIQKLQFFRFLGAKSLKTSSMINYMIVYSFIIFISYVEFSIEMQKRFQNKKYMIFKFVWQNHKLLRAKQHTKTKHFWVIILISIIVNSSFCLYNWIDRDLIDHCNKFHQI